jgi:beta-glucosidase
MAALAMTSTTPAEAAGRCGEPPQRPWCDTALSPERRADLLLEALTPAERISLLAGDDVFGVLGGPQAHTGTSNGVERVGLPPVYFSDGPVGPRQGPATAMPIPMALAATWDARLARKHGATIADEASKKGNDVVFAPAVNIMRTPLGGRTFEAYGEDPFLSSRMTVGWIEGAQSRGVIADVKHYLANNQEGAGPAANASAPGQPLGPPGPDGNRYFANAIIDERTMREVYLPQFEAAVREAHVGTVMCAYNRINGRYACEHPEALVDILRRDWGFRGFVLADYGAAHDTIASLNSGLDFEPWEGLVYSPGPVAAAMAAGAVPASTVDEHVRWILRTLFAFGFFDRAAFVNDDAQIDQAANAATAQAIEEAAITLLENRGALPLDAEALSSVAVVGRQGTEFVTGGGSGAVTPFTYTSPLEAIRRRAGPGVTVTYDDGSDVAAAAARARASDVAIVFAGDYQTEGADRACLSLQCPDRGDQDGLIRQVAAAQPNTVVVLQTGGPVLTPWRNNVAALLEAWYPGARGGPAIARVLFGDVDPGGRLPATFPRAESDLPTAGDPEKYPGVAQDVQYKEGVFVGHRWFDAHRLQPAYPFGFGRSYTRFRFSDLRLASRRSGGGVTATVKVTNAGRRTGVAVAQLYLGRPSPGSAVPEPPRVLKAFAKLRLDPGKARRVRLELDERAFSYWDAELDTWRVAKGCHTVWVGASSRALPLRATVRRGGAKCRSRAR